MIIMCVKVAIKKLEAKLCGINGNQGKQSESKAETDGTRTAPPHVHTFTRSNPRLHNAGINRGVLTNERLGFAFQSSAPKKKGRDAVSEGSKKF